MCCWRGVPLLLALLAGPAARASCASYQDFMHWIGGLETNGAITDVAIVGGYAVTTHTQFGLVVVDIGDPTDLSVADLLPTPGDPFRLAVSGTRAFVADGPAGMLVADISNPLAVGIMGTVATNGLTLDVAVQGEYAYLADRDEGLVIVDISTPTNPQIVENLITPEVWGVAVSGDYAFLVGMAGLLMVDVSDPQHPWLMHTIPPLGSPQSVETSGDYVYVADEEGLMIVDVSNPLLPVVNGTLEMQSGCCVSIVGDLAYFSREGFGLTAIDIQDPWSPVELAGVDLLSAGSAAVSGEYAYVGGAGGLRVVDVSALALPGPVGSLPLPGNAGALDAAGNYAYAALSGQGLQIIDISNPAVPTLGGFANTGEAQAVRVAGNHAYVGGWQSVRCVDVSDPLNPVLRGEASLLGDAWDIETAGGYAYLTDSEFGLRIIDVSEPDSLHLVGGFGIPWPAGLEVEGDYAFIGLAESESALVILDISQPTAPMCVASLPTTPGEADTGDLVLHGNYAYLLLQGWPADTLQVVDISNPASPHNRGYHTLPSRSQWLAVAGDYLYVACNTEWNHPSWMQIYSLADPADPCPAGGVWAADCHGLSGIVVSGESVCLADYQRGLLVMPAQCGSSSAALASESDPRLLLQSPAPNPMVRSTDLRFQLPSAGPTELSIWDVGGRCVRTLHRGMLDAGAQQVAWDGRDETHHPVPHGVYFVRLEWGPWRETARLIVVR